jgi:secreted PhoX family phosphatase
MKKIYFGLALAAGSVLTSVAQTNFPIQINTIDYAKKSITVPASPIRTQVLFIGGVDQVQTLNSSGQPNGSVVSKQWHDFIGFTPDVTVGTSDLGWVTVNHEMVEANAAIGDGGGMTSFKIRRDPTTGQLVVVYQTLTDGRRGQFFNVDFVNTVGNTGMNCAGIQGRDGRIWTAEEWFQNTLPTAFTETSDFTIGTTTPAGFPGFNGSTISRVQNLNWMVEIDPRQAKAVRKQYNWGRAGWEGGCVAADGTVYLGEDATPGAFTKFVPTNPNATPIDYTQGKLYVYKHDNPGTDKWVEIDNSVLANMTGFKTKCGEVGASAFNRLEWIAFNETDGKVYFTETGSDNLNFTSAVTAGWVIAPHFAKAYRDFYLTTKGTAFTGTDADAIDSVRTGKFKDYYGRVLVYDPVTQQVTSLIEGGPYFASSPANANYPAKHLSNPDGLNVLHVNGKTYLVIMEDLIGRSFGRMPSEFSSGTQTVCEVFLLDLSIVSPTVNDLIKIAACAPGAEITGCAIIENGNTMLINSQHPDTGNDYPYNNSVTFAITNISQALQAITTSTMIPDEKAAFTVWPNPTSSELYMNKVTDVAVYDVTGTRVRVARGVDYLNIEDLDSGVYFILNSEGESIKVVIE